MRSMTDEGAACLTIAVAPVSARPLIRGAPRPTFSPEWRRIEGRA
jgi:hypothetical protein